MTSHEPCPAAAWICNGFGFVEMSTKEEGAAAIQKFKGQEVGGRALNADEAKPRESRVAGGGGLRY